MANDSSTPNLEPRVAVLEQIAADMRDALARIERRLEALDKRQHTDFLWLVSLIIGGWATTFAGFAGVLGVLAHGFKWI